MPARTLVIGDIHGCSAQLDALLQAIAPAPNDRIVFLGDYVDRGPDSAGVLRRIIALSQSHRVSALRGNHEQMMLEARDSCDKSSEWFRNGGGATLRSYGGRLEDVPPEHWQFLERDLLDYLETETHLFVHASAYPDLAMDEQPDYMLRWERCDDISAHESGKVIVCGHTPQKSGRPLNRGYAICLDTHACGGGPLSCLHAESGRLWQADPDGAVRRSHIADD